jgi:cobalt-zinc-cadmium efflux system outer membrane protein
VAVTGALAARAAAQCCKECQSMRACSPLFGRPAASLLLALGVSAVAAAQTPPVQPTSALTRVSMDDAVRLALVHNHALQAQRFGVDVARADEITAGLKPNPIFTSLNQYFPVFTPSELTGDTLANGQAFTQGLSYLFERGGKRQKRLLVAQDTTDFTAKATADVARQITFQTRQAFINVLLAKSTLDLAQQDLQDFSNVVEVNRQRMVAGDLAEGDFYKISLQKLQFETDVSAAQVALVQAKAELRLDVGLESLPEDFDVDGDLAYKKYALSLEDFRREALASRPDLLAAQSGLKLARDAQTLAFGNRARDVTGEVEYERNGPQNAVGFGFSIDLPIHDRNQGNIAHSLAGVRQATESELQAQGTVLTDVASAWAAYQSADKVVSIYQSGYLDQATQSLQISTYVYQQGAGSLLDLLDAERTYRSTQLAYRQALATYMTNVQQVNFVAGRQVMP